MNSNDKYPQASVHPNAKIGENVVVAPFVFIDDNVEIGDGTIIDSHAVILSGARIGRNCHIHVGAVISNVPQDLKFKGEETIAIIGDNTSIREYVTVHRGTASRGRTVVGSNCLIMAYSHVAHDCVIGDHVIMSNAVQVAGEVEIGDWAVVGGGALIHQFSHIGPHAMLQGGSKVSKDIPPFVLCGRYPVCYEGVNSIGMRRRGYTDEQINNVQDIYRMLFFSGKNLSDALADVESTLPDTAERRIIADFLRSSTRAVIKPGI